MEDQRLERIEDKLDKIAETLTQQAILHERQTVTLEVHVKRTDLIEESLKPLKQTDTVLRASIKAIALLGVILTILYTVIKIIQGL